MNYLLDFIMNFTNDSIDNSETYPHLDNKYRLKISEISGDLIQTGELIATNLGFNVILLTDNLFRFKETDGMDEDYNLDISIRIVDEYYEFSLIVYNEIETDDE